MRCANSITVYLFWNPVIFWPIEVTVKHFRTNKAVNFFGRGTGRKRIVMHLNRIGTNCFNITNFCFSAHTHNLFIYFTKTWQKSSYMSGARSQSVYISSPAVVVSLCIPFSHFPSIYCQIFQVFPKIHFSAFIFPCFLRNDNLTAICEPNA
jgi:hypothetical protein